YTETVRLLKELHFLTMEGKEESEEAEVICSKMDQHWYKLDSQEQERIGILSADLRMLEGKEIFRQVPDGERTREYLSPKLQEASEHQDWAKVLELLRNGPDFLSSDQLAYLRGQGYSKLGHQDIALLFYQYAAETNPTVAHYPTLV